MDLRKKKNLRAIREAFFAIRRQKELEQMTVTELVKKAEISRATFYLHYKDIYDLSQQLQQEVIHASLERLCDPMDILNHSSVFFRAIVDVLYEEKDTISVLFSGSQFPMLPVMIEDYLKAYIYRQAPHLEEDYRFSIYLSYRIYGGFSAYLRNADKLGLAKFLEIMEEIHIPLR